MRTVIRINSPLFVPLHSILSRKGNMRKTYALFLIVFLLSFGAAIAGAPQSKKEPRIGVLGAPEEPRFTEIVAGLKKRSERAWLLPADRADSGSQGGEGG